MDEATRARVFEPFFTTKPVGVGTGLGLASAYAIVTDHGGSITCKSQPGSGACFEIELPAAGVPRDITAPRKAHADTTPSAGHETILVVDDEPLVRRVLRALLEDAGYVVSEASHGVEALEELARDQPRIDLAVIDRSMPEMSGEEVLVQMAARYPTVPVLFLSGNPGATAPNAQVLSVLAKPLDTNTFLRVVREALDARRGCS